MITIEISSQAQTSGGIEETIIIDSVSSGLFIIKNHYSSKTELEKVHTRLGTRNCYSEKPDSKNTGIVVHCSYHDQKGKEREYYIEWGVLVVKDNGLKILEIDTTKNESL